EPRVTRSLAAQRRPRVAARSPIHAAPADETARAHVGVAQRAKAAAALARDEAPVSVAHRRPRRLDAPRSEIVQASEIAASAESRALYCGNRLINCGIPPHCENSCDAVEMISDGDRGHAGSLRLPGKTTNRTSPEVPPLRALLLIPSCVASATEPS